MMKLERLSWDDLKFALGLARHPTMAAAAAALHVHQSTVSRRIHALEEQMGVKLFRQGEAGIVMTEAGRAVARRAEKIEALTQGLEGDIETERTDDRQSVRISAASSFISSFLNVHASAFLTAHRHIRLDFVGEERNAVLERDEADIALRLARPTAGAARIRKLVDLGVTTFAAPSLTDGRGNLLPDAPWVGYSRPLNVLPEQQWIENNISPRNVVMTVASGATYVNAVNSGIGAGLLSYMIGDNDPKMIRISPAKPIVHREAWLMVLDDTRRRPAVRTVISWLSDICRAHAPAFMGNTTDND